MRAISASLVFFAIVTQRGEAFSCEEAIEAISPFGRNVHSCDTVGGLPIIKYEDENSAGLVNCDSIITMYAAHGQAVTDCLMLNGTVMFRIDNKYNWTAAWAACHIAPGGDLVSIHDIHEFKATFDLLDAVEYFQAVNVWIGLTDEGEEGVYRWAQDGSIPTYTKFCKEEASRDGREQNCVYAINWIDEVRLKRCWHTASCSEEFPAICKISLRVPQKTFSKNELMK